jgi:hypothetical protein
MKAFEKEKNSNLLEVEVKNYSECGFCKEKETEEKLIVPFNIFSQWLYLLFVMGDKEWGGVFWVKDQRIVEFKIPQQEVTSGDCEFKEELGGDGIIHSHHNMGAFHSAQDDRQSRNLYKYSIVISNSGYEASAKVKLPCDGWGYTTLKLMLEDTPISTEKIEVKSFSYDKYYDDNYDYGYNYNKPKRRKDYQQNFPFEENKKKNCEICSTFDCEDCPIGKDYEGEELLPFCDWCTDTRNCERCWKMEKYNENYQYS